MKETRELRQATEARRQARLALAQTTHKLRGRLTPRMIATDVAGMIATRAGEVFLKSGISKRRRVAAAASGVAAIASAIALRSVQKGAFKKKR